MSYKKSCPYCVEYLNQFGNCNFCDSNKEFEPVVSIKRACKRCHTLTVNRNFCEPCTNSPHTFTAFNAVGHMNRAEKKNG